MGWRDGFRGMISFLRDNNFIYFLFPFLWYFGNDCYFFGDCGGLWRNIFYGAKYLLRKFMVEYEKLIIEQL
jgi:hypothetical protein